MFREMNKIQSPISLPRLPPVVFFFGLAGAGKSYVGDMVNRLTQRPLYHADCDLTARMRQAMATETPFTQDMRDEFFEVVADRILEKLEHNPELIITQGAYKNCNRQYLLTKVPQLEFVQIAAKDQTIVDRLRIRGDLVSIDYAQKLRANFEVPPIGTKIIHNDSDDDNIVQQLVEYFG